MKVLLDTNVVLDFLQNRKPYAEAALTLFQAVATGQFSGYISAKSVTDIFYLMHRFNHSNEETRVLIQTLLGIVSLADTVASDVLYALTSETADYEDAVLIETAKREKIDCIVTRNVKDFTHSTVPVYDPDQFIEFLTTI